MTINLAPMPDDRREHEAPAKPGGGGAASLLAELRGGETARPEPGAAPRKPSRVSGQTLVLVLVLGVSAASLFTMRQMSKRSGIRLETVDVAYVPDENARRRAVDQARIVRFLSESGSPVQVPRESLDKNPFFLGLESTSLPIGADPAEVEAHRAAELAREQAAQRQEEIQNHLASFTLHSVLGGRNPIARINDVTVRPGDTLNDLFKVVSIEGRSVTLECDGKSYALDLDARKGAAPGTSARPR
ncbi:MAG: hypothetical protein FJ255_00105 [Phycisphaerae bacterium]|nr:hypothetical protein [Phycisphaerae bacterium]